MFKPMYRLSVFPESENALACTSAQLIKITKCSSLFFSLHTWFCADVEILGTTPKTQNLYTEKLQKLGGLNELTSMCKQVSQFIWGEFIAISNECLNQDFSSIDLSAEDKPFRCIYLQGVLLEIRAFDSSYFEIYSEDKAILSSIGKNFNSKLESI